MSKDLARAEGALNLSLKQCLTLSGTEKAVKAMLEAKRQVVYNHGPELVGILVRGL